jgi:cell wall assembly regulator SMI1
MKGGEGRLGLECPCPMRPFYLYRQVGALATPPGPRAAAKGEGRKFPPQVWCPLWFPLHGLAGWALWMVRR